MKVHIALLILFSVIFTHSPGFGQPQVDMGVSLGPEGLRNFYFSIHEYFRVPEKEVIVVRERRIPDEEIPVVFFIANRARALHTAIIDLRLSGKSWMDITLHFGLSPEIYYVPVKIEVKGPPYGKAYGYYKNQPKKEWKKIKLVDAEVINFVNLRFISEYHQVPAEQVIKMRSDNKHFVVIHDEVKKEKGKKGDLEGQGKGKGKGSGKGQEKGKGKGKDG